MAVVGWLSTIFLALGGVPQAIKVYKEGHARGIAMGMLVLWFVGEILLTLYAVTPLQIPLLVNAAFNTLVAGFILKFKIFERKKTLCPSREKEEKSYSA